MKGCVGLRPGALVPGLTRGGPTPHGAVISDVFLDDPHVAVEIPPAAQVKLFRSGNEFQNV